MLGSDVSSSPSLRLVLAGAWWALRGRGLEGRGPDGRGPAGRGWGRLLALLEAARGGAPGALGSRHWARLSLGIRAQMVTSVLRESGPSPAVLDALDWLFPEGAEPGNDHAQEVGAWPSLAPPPPPHAPIYGQSVEGRPLVALAEESFREQVLGILGSGRGLRAFLQEYGPRFRHSLGNLYLEFLRRLEASLPPPDLAQLERLCRSHALPGSRPRPLPLLRRYLAEVGHAHQAPVPRPLPPHRDPPPVKPRPHRRRLRPLRFLPYREWLSSSSSLA